MHQSTQQLLALVPFGLFDWIPFQWFRGLSIFDPQLILLCSVFVVLGGLGLVKAWCNLTDRPLVFAAVYSVPFFLFGFGNFFGDAHQWIESINGRYFMSEPGATAIHYWFNVIFGHRLNLSPLSALTITSRIAGFLFLWGTACLSCTVLSSASSQQRFVFRMVYFTAGVSLLFYGYAENTPLALPAEQLWVITVVHLLRAPTNANILRSSAAFSVAFFIHGRVGFVALAYAFALLLPSGSAMRRLQRLLLGGGFSLILVACAVTYIFLFERQHVMGNPFGNVTGGGNRQMFVSLERLSTWRHWHEIFTAALFGAGLIAPLGIAIGAMKAIQTADRLYVWILLYICAAVVYLGLWEFDFGPFVDWDLIFSGTLPVIFITALAISNLRYAAVLSLMPLWVCGCATLFIGTIINGSPFAVNWVKTAQPSADGNVCADMGLKRVYYSDINLQTQIGEGVPARPLQDWGPAATPLPTKPPFGVRYTGYLKINDPGRYHFSIVGTGNLRVRIGEQTLYERWSGIEWRVGIERQLRFPSSGWYPIIIEMSTTVHAVPLKLAVSANQRDKHFLKMEELCYQFSSGDGKTFE